MKFLRLIGAFCGIGSLIFCSYMLLFNPYTHSSVEPDVFTSFTVMYLIPISLATYASISLKPKLLIICSIWALPLSLYCLATPGLFKYIVIGPVLLFIVGVKILKNKRIS
ncbi:hypothetical protein QNH48_05160 [Neobacillus sp. YX16]|uniref:hypothetical protein n=1 Tax=Neobacillus sp. YX16 TaxID=3047874 RepID=UPI0024C40BA7|nr:hypothetical protein [Neobacillus sp. YX16]WHZ04053.1 hypothetical protein QNH48_05160 [Neobacillus sp. YX16]